MWRPENAAILSGQYPRNAYPGKEATRALFAGKRERFLELVEPWPADVRAYACGLAAAALAGDATRDETGLRGGD
jgi:hypothetical protein